MIPPPPISPLFPYTTLFRSKNPLFIFVLAGVLPRLQGLIRIPNGISESGNPLYISPLGWFFEYICKPLFGQHRSEEHTSELQSRGHLVCRLLLEKNNIISDN